MKRVLTYTKRHGLKRRERGLTLIELIIGIVVLGIAAVAITATLSRTTVFNTDPLVRVQSLALAESYLEEVLGRPFYQPDGNPLVDTTIDPGDEAICPSTPPSSTGSRADWSVCDYHNLSLTALTTPDSGPLNGLAGYELGIQVNPSTINGAVPDTACALEIKVTITPPAGDALTLTGYRTSYWEECAG